jgi:hypothetical protein
MGQAWCKLGNVTLKNEPAICNESEISSGIYCSLTSALQKISKTFGNTLSFSRKHVF